MSYSAQPSAAKSPRYARRPLHREDHPVRARYRNTSAAVQIDHVVALANAWQSGARDSPPPSATASAMTPTICSPWIPRQPGQGIRLRRLLASHQRRVSLRIRRAADRRQTALRSDRHHQRETFDARRAARMPRATDPQSVRGGIEPIARQMPQSAQRGSRVAGNSTVCYKRGVYH